MRPKLARQEGHYLLIEIIHQDNVTIICTPNNGMLPKLFIKPIALNTKLISKNEKGNYIDQFL